MQQGVVEAAPGFCALFDPEFKDLDVKLHVVGGAVRAAMDDVYIIDFSLIIFFALREFKPALMSICRFVLRED